MLFWPVRLATTLMRGLGLVATQTLTFSFSDIDGRTAMARRLGDEYAGTASGHHRVIQAGQAAHGG